MDLADSLVFDVIKKSSLEDGNTGKAISYATAGKWLRQMHMRDKDSEEGKISAAIEIQRVFRGYQSRCILLQNLEVNISKRALYDGSRDPSVRIKDFEDHRNEVKHSKSTTDHPGMDAIKKDLSGVTAAKVIQRAWRRHVDMQIFRWYKDLINLKNRGEPSVVLRCINPIEAKLLDAAAGVHVKFRLAGAEFPPSIYYKIYTHRPVQDLCANSPKDYTKADAKRMTHKDVHNNYQRSVFTDTSSWYQRIENNGWRPVSHRVLQHPMNDAITWESSNKRLSFPHSKLQRKSDIEKIKRKKKIEWLKKMYHEGMLKAKVEDEETVKLIQGAAAGMVATMERHGDEVVPDWEVDELLDWTTTLNFDEYLKGWKENATSASEKPVADRMKCQKYDLDPYEMISHKEAPTRQSHNTPVSSAASLPDD